VSKNKASMDNADLLALRQGEVLATLMVGIQQGGLTPEEWLNLSTWRLSQATRGLLSPRVVYALNYMDDNGLYKKPERLSQLVKLLRWEFNKVQREYLKRGLLTVEPLEQEVRSTLSATPPSLEEVELEQMIQDVVEKHEKSTNPETP